MAQIIIRERDLTSNPAQTIFDVAFVPGLTTMKPTDEGIHWEYNKPYYVDSLATFKSQFGISPVQLTGEGIPYVYSREKGITTNPTLGGAIGGSDHQLDLVCGVGANPVTYEQLSHYSDREITGFQSGVTVTVDNVIPRTTVEGTTTPGSMVQVEENGELVTVELTAVETDIAKQFFGRIVYDPTDDQVASVIIETNVDATIRYEYGGSEQEKTLGDIRGGLNVLVDGYYRFRNPESRYFFKGGSGVFDNGYIYAAELLAAGIPLYYCPIEGTEANDVYNALLHTEEEEVITRDPQTSVVTDRKFITRQSSILNQLADRGTFNIKYITSGGYPTYEYETNSVASLMLQMASALTDEEPTTDDYQDDPSIPSNGRGDCVAFIDHFELDDRPLLGEGSVYWMVNTPSMEDQKPLNGLQGMAGLSFGAMFTPYANYSLQTSYTYLDGENKPKRATTHYFPASFAYLTCLAKQLHATLPSYEAIAGVARGSVKNIVFDATTNSYQVCTKDVLTNYIANHYNSMPQADGNTPISINGITQINPYGLVIYGTRTLAQKSATEGVKATGILNIRNMVSDIKKQMYQSARRYMYSANNDALWINFRSSVVGLLNQMQQGYGIKSWSLKKDMAKSTKSSLYVLCSIQPVYPVEKFDITIEITDEDIEVNEA